MASAFESDVLTLPVAFEPLGALLLLGAAILLLRWTFSGGKSLIAKPPRSGKPDDYGLLTPICDPDTADEARQAQHALARAGIVATVTNTTEGTRVMVFAEDAQRARDVLHLT
ncbi:hypothetical protein LWF01_10000 [Saxibacter everestensis]|uniref:DUF2007 domain-containing protein n=1 Tax=Saxibacter everestensis TaxID=2909229 RepID=A0ABY8QQE6_9MICO|nr:hypothetical protein LWF01_10000 [Brevibacteriaceae bacterium ZFBP1038]